MNTKEKLVPELRFPEFTDEWEEKKLGEIGEVLSCKRIYERETSLDYEIPFYKISTFGKEADAYITRELYENYRKNYNYPKKGDVLISASGTIGRTVIYNGEEAYFQDSNIVWLNIIKKDKLLNTFLYFYYQTITWDKLEGGTIKRLYNKDLLNLKSTFPSLPEQEKIGNFFYKIDKKLDLQRERIEELKDYKKAMMQRIFNQEIRFKDEKGNEYPEWEEKKLGEIAKIKTGNSNVKDATENGKYTFFDRSIIIKRINKYDYDEEAIIYPGEGSEFYPRYYKGKYALHQRAYSITSNYLNLKYLTYCLMLKNNYFLKMAVGSTVKSLRMDNFMNCTIQLPSLPEQEKIANFLSAIDEKIELEEEKLEEFEKFKKGLMQRMFI